MTADVGSRPVDSRERGFGGSRCAREAPWPTATQPSLSYGVARICGALLLTLGQAQQLFGGFVSQRH
jgi:hypothetical protein